jgi:UDP-glucose 4-epimerase
MAYRQALVTGGAGFIGSHLVEALLEKGCAVKILDNLSTGRLENLTHVRERVNFFQGDIRDTRLLAEAVRGCDVVFHQAAMVSVPKSVENPIESLEINDLGTLRVLEAARKNGVRKAVLASSCAVYGNDPQLPKHEALPLKPMSPYAVHKLIGESYARLYTELYGLETACLRYFNVYGPRQDPSSPYSGVISIFLSRAIKRQRPIIFGDGAQYRDFIYVKDVVRANMLAAESSAASGNVYNIGTGSFLRILDLWKAIRDRLAVHIEPEFAPCRLGDIRESLADVHRAREHLGFEAQYPFDIGLDATLKWYMENSAFL